LINKRGINGVTQKYNNGHAQSFIFSARGEVSGYSAKFPWMLSAHNVTQNS